MGNPPGGPREQGRRVSALLDFVLRYPRLFVLTGAGISTDSGIPGYRDERGQWQRSAPTTLQAFVGSHAARQRYWARSMLGWPIAAHAQPNVSHHVVAGLGAQDRLSALVTQNVDGLHQRAGSPDVVELHGSLRGVVCMSCGTWYERAGVQQWLWDQNAALRDIIANPLADGDVELETPLFAEFRVPVCERCEGMLKPDVVFFGESVPLERVDRARDGLARADAMLVIGSSLTVRSGYRFALWASETGKPVAALNLGVTRADPLLSLKVDAPIAPAMEALAAALRIDIPAASA
ncbi:NAD-dependent protein deacetylase [Cupriavidus plantarum]|uniref:NAD-dependent protein deacetylase n=1 Tax=Cupriavidus plantarum TaxID=942865 RepID=UPI000E3B1CC0|nr:NAD-dependent protein deacetylase [Cupriavidus plantarum]REE88888.1 NAD-dependent SIR2 family protein deacetylase [Cupriavidus plantarum]CAG2153350.1 NAD-dependent protein deacetylase [Cupriavidus plantarum]SMR86305.1 NAD-dependent protein deacetylase, SIR2 family [Cupriavidus plantarum]